MLEPIDYLLIGHISIDHSPLGDKLGGTVAYSALTAKALGLRTGIVTSWGEELELSELNGIQILNYRSKNSSKFENIYTDKGRVQRILSVANKIEPRHIPQEWQDANVVHLGPVADEISSSIIQSFKTSFLVATPQGWMRKWRTDGLIEPKEWKDAEQILERLDAVVISSEDLDYDEKRISEFAKHSAILAVTNSSEGTRLFWQGEEREFIPPQIKEVDATGAGDIFATCFFVRLYTTLDPWESCRFATSLAAYSVTRRGLDSVPTEEEIVKTINEMGN